MDKRLAIVFWDLGIGGIQTRMKGVIARIIEQHPNTHITFLLYERKKTEITIQNPLVSIKTFPGPIIFNIFGWRKKFWRFTTLQFLIWLYVNLKKSNPTHIITFLNRLSLYVAIYVYFYNLINKKIALVINESIVVSTYLQQYDPKWWRLFQSFSYQVAHKIIVATESVKKDLIKQFGVDRHKIVIVKSWVSSNE